MYLWMELNGEKLHYYKIKNHVWFALSNVANFNKKSGGFVKATFNRISKKFFKELDDDFFVEGKDFIQRERIDLSVNNEIPINRENNQDNIVFLTYLGLWKILATFRDDYTTWIYHRMSEYEYNRIRYKRYDKKELKIPVPFKAFVN